MLNGFDASGFSGYVDCVAAKNAGMSYAVFRVGRGIPDTATDFDGIDLRWTENKDNAIEAGLPVGGYWRFFPSIDLMTQVNRFTRALKQSNGMLAPWVDIEDHGNLSPQVLTNWTIEILIQIQIKTNRKPVLYTGKNFYDTRLEYWRLDRWELAIAWQTTGTWREYGSVFWQYLLDTSVPWSQGRVDLQKFALDTLEYHTKNHEMIYWFDSNGMLHGPQVWSDKLLPEAGSQGRQYNRIAIIHTMVGYLNGTDTYFRRSDIGLESSFGIGGQYDGPQLDGAIYQWMRIFDVADANGEANYYGASWETSDGGGERYKEWWSQKQSESLAQSIAAWCLFFNRPAVLIDRALPNRTGIAYHRQGVPGYKNPEDDSWSPDKGKICPGFERSDQLVRVIIPRVQQILSSVKSIPVDTELPKEVEMNLDDVVGIDSKGNSYTVRQALAHAMGLSIPEPTDLSQIAELVKNTRDELVRVVVCHSDNSVKWGEIEGYTWTQLSNYKWGELYELFS